MSAESTKKRGPGRPAQPISKSEILDVALAAFARAGFAAASLSEIASSAGLRKSSLYHHFPTKQLLYDAVIERIVSDLGGLILHARPDEQDYVKRFDHLGDLVVDYFATRRQSARLLALELVSDGPFMQREGSRHVQTTIETIAAFLQQGMDAGVFHRRDARQLALSVVGLHLTYFAAHAASSRVIGKDVFSPEAIQERKEALLTQTRTLCVRPG